MTSRIARVLAELVVACLAIALWVWSWRVGDRWFLRTWSLDSRKLWIATAWRLAAVAAGAILVVVVRPRASRWASRVGSREALAACARTGLAFCVAVAVSELALRVLDTPRKHDREHQCDPTTSEPHPRYGWVWRASQTFTKNVGHRDLTYAFDANHDRAPTAVDAPDPERPTILFVGESIVAGHGLMWDESLPALVGRALGVQVVTLGVDGYASDQAFLRFADALPHYAHVLAVVTLFYPGLVNRVAWVDHPQLAFDGDEPTVTPPHPGFASDLRVVRLLRDVLPYRDEASIELTGKIFRETARLASLRGARAIFVTPWLGKGWPPGEGYLIDELLVKQGLTVVNPDFGYIPLPIDKHPDAACTRRLADAVVAEMRRSLGPDGAPGQ
jgi:hypothetical protein